MIWIANELSGWAFALFALSLVSLVSVLGYFKFGINHSLEGGLQQISDYFQSSPLIRKVITKLNGTNKETTDQKEQLNLPIGTNSNQQKYSTFGKMTSFIKPRTAIDERRAPRHDTEPESFIYSSIFSFTKTLINRANPLTNTARKSQAEPQLATKQQQQQQSAQHLNPNLLLSPNQTCSTNHPSNDRPEDRPIRNAINAVKPTLHGTMSSMHTMTALNDETGTSSNKHVASISKSVSLQIRDEMKAAIPRNRLLHQSSSGSVSSNSSTPADLFSLAEKGRIGSNRNFRKHKPLINHKVHQKPSNYTELVSQIQNHEDAINREYLLHQLNPSQYHSMHYYRRLERQNCLNGNRKSLSSDKKKKITKQDTVQSNSSNQENSNELEHFTSSSSSNLSCSECGSLDTEEELTLPFMKKAGHYQPSVSLRSKQPLKLSSSLDKSNLINPITKQCSSDSNEAMVGLLNENLIKRQLSNGTYMKLSDRLTNDKLTDKRKQILGRRLTSQNSFSAGSSFNNSSNNSSFDHDDMLVQFTSHQANSFSSTDANNHFHYNHYENNSIHSNDTSSSSNSSCGHRHAERSKLLNEFGNSLNICDDQMVGQLSDRHLSQMEQADYNLCPNNNVLHVTHAYDPTTRKLKIRILKADYVPMKMTNNRDCDRCYVKLILLPNKRQKFKTTVKSCTTSPIEFDELFTFNRISPDAIMSLSIKYLFYLVNNESKHRNIGEALIRFENWKPMQQEDNLIVYLDTINMNVNGSLQKCNFNVIANEQQQQQDGLNKQNTANNESLSDVSSICRSDSAESRHSLQPNLPELLIGLAYNATTGRLQVAIIKGSQFKAKSNKPPDTFVKVTLLSSAGREIGRNKTTVKRTQPNPVYKQTFAFQVPAFQLPDVSLMIGVYNKKSMNRKEMIGWFSLGCNASGEEENQHWNEMRDSTCKGEQICRWHVLSESS